MVIRDYESPDGSLGVRLSLSTGKCIFENAPVISIFVFLLVNIFVSRLFVGLILFFPPFSLPFLALPLFLSFERTAGLGALCYDVLICAEEALPLEHIVEN